MGADLLDQGCMSAEAAGFDIFLIVHDQALCYEHPNMNFDEFVGYFTKVDSWADTFPLDAEGDVVPYYTKD